VNYILKLFIDIIILRRGPQDVPASRNLFITSGLLLVVVAVIADHLSDDIINSIVLAVTQVSILSITVWIILSLNKKPERALQTLTAIYGTSILIQLAVWPFRTWLLSMGEEAQKQLTIPLLAVVMLAIWAFIVMIHIYRNALDASLGKSIAVSILTQLVVSLSILSLFTDLQQGLPQ
jgi:hypothetical protein